MAEAPRISLARLPTPLEHLQRLSDHCGVEIWIKRDDLTESAAAGNKIRKLEYSIGQALAENADVLITFGGVQSNHCRATAVMAAKLGLKSHLVLRGREPEQPDGNLLLDHLVGAEVSIMSPDEYQQTEKIVAELTEHYAQRNQKVFVIPVGASDEIGLWGYINCAAELKADFEQHGISPGAIVSATGSGGTLGGLILGKSMHNLSPEITAFNVCDDEAYFINKISEDFAAFSNRYDIDLTAFDLPINVIDGYVGPGYGRATSNVFETISLVAQLEGIVLDPVYTGKAFDGMLTEAAGGRLQDKGPLVFVHTGGIFGLFPQKDQLLQVGP